MINIQSVMGGDPKQESDPYAQYKGLLSAQPVEMNPPPKGEGGQRIYDKPELERLVSALRRLGIFDLALPPEVFRPNPTKAYALPQPSGLYGTEDISF